MIFTQHNVIIPEDTLSLLLSSLQYVPFVLPVTNPGAAIASGVLEQVRYLYLLLRRIHVS
jgi:hypothetical protein